MYRLFIGLAMLSTPALGQAPLVFGMELGKPVSLPTCARARLSDGTFSTRVYERAPSRTCHEPDEQLRDAPWRRGAVTFPTGKSPLIMSGTSGYTLIVDGRLEGLDIDTLDHNNTDAIMRELTAKFGSPTSVLEDRAIVAGISLPSMVASWRLPTMHVRYTNINDDLEVGRLLIETPAMQRLREEHERATEKARTPL